MNKLVPIGDVVSEIAAVADDICRKEGIDTTDFWMALAKAWYAQQDASEDSEQEP